MQYNSTTSNNDVVENIRSQNSHNEISLGSNEMRIAKNQPYILDNPIYLGFNGDEHLLAETTDQNSDLRNVNNILPALQDDLDILNDVDGHKTESPTIVTRTLGPFSTPRRTQATVSRLGNATGAVATPNRPSPSTPTLIKVNQSSVANKAQYTNQKSPRHLKSPVKSINSHNINIDNRSPSSGSSRPSGDNSRMIPPSNIPHHTSSEFADVRPTYFFEGPDVIPSINESLLTSTSMIKGDTIDNNTYNHILPQHLDTNISIISIDKGYITHQQHHQSSQSPRQFDPLLPPPIESNRHNGHNNSYHTLASRDYHRHNRPQSNCSVDSATMGRGSMSSATNVMNKSKTKDANMQPFHTKRKIDRDIDYQVDLYGGMDEILQAKAAADALALAISGATSGTTTDITINSNNTSNSCINTPNRHIYTTSTGPNDSLREGFKELTVGNIVNIPGIIPHKGSHTHSSSSIHQLQLSTLTYCASDGSSLQSPCQPPPSSHRLDVDGQLYDSRSTKGPYVLSPHHDDNQPVMLAGDDTYHEQRKRFTQSTSKEEWYNTMKSESTREISHLLPMPTRVPRGATSPQPRQMRVCSEGGNTNISNRQSNEDRTNMDDDDDDDCYGCHETINEDTTCTTSTILHNYNNINIKNTPNNDKDMISPLSSMDINNMMRMPLIFPIDTHISADDNNNSMAPSSTPQYSPKSLIPPSPHRQALNNPGPSPSAVPLLTSLNQTCKAISPSTAPKLPPLTSLTPSKHLSSDISSPHVYNSKNKSGTHSTPWPTPKQSSNMSYRATPLSLSRPHIATALSPRLLAPNISGTSTTSSLLVQPTSISLAAHDIKNSYKLDPPPIPVSSTLPCDRDDTSPRYSPRLNPIKPSHEIISSTIIAPNTSPRQPIHTSTSSRNVAIITPSSAKNIALTAVEQSSNHPLTIPQQSTMSSQPPSTESGFHPGITNKPFKLSSAQLATARASTSRTTTPSRRFTHSTFHVDLASMTHQQNNHHNNQQHTSPFATHKHQQQHRSSSVEDFLDGIQSPSEHVVGLHIPSQILSPFDMVFGDYELNDAVNGQDSNEQSPQAGGDGSKCSVSVDDTISPSHQGSNCDSIPNNRTIPNTVSSSSSKQPRRHDIILANGRDGQIIARRITRATDEDGVSKLYTHLKHDYEYDDEDDEIAVTTGQ